MLLILDLLLLAFTLTVLSAISVARMRGKLPHRGFGRSMQSRSPRAGRITPAGTKADSFRGILAHYDGPVQLVQPTQTTS